MRYFELSEDAVTLLTGAVYARIHWLQEQQAAMRELTNGLFSDEQISLYNQCGDKNNLNFAVQYVVSQLNYVAVHSTYSDMCNKREPLYHINPSMADTIVDLLEEYGEDNDLAEGWWMYYGDIEDIFKKIL